MMATTLGVFKHNSVKVVCTLRRICQLQGRAAVAGRNRLRVHDLHHGH